MVRRLSSLPAVVVLAASLWSCSSEDAPPESSAADAPVRSTTTTAPPPPVLERVAADPAVLGGEGDQRLVAVAAGVGMGGGSLLVAVGSSGGTPAIWSSADGSQWVRADLPVELFGEGVTLADVAPNPAGGGWAVVGGDGGQAAAWVSLDGQRWQRAVVDAGPAITTVGATSVGLIAFGAGADGVMAWSSLFGDRWARAVAAPTLFDRPEPAEVVAVVDAGLQVQAVVQREGAGPELWRSEDGVRWSSAPVGEAALLPASGFPGAGAATSLGSALVVVGSDAKVDGTDGSMWLSTDARSFEQIPHDEAALGGDGAQVMSGVAPVGDRLMIVGTETDEAGDLDAVVWASSIGSGIERVADDGPAVPGHQHVVDLAVIGSTPVAVGWEQTADGSDAVAWVVRSVPDEEAAPAPAEGPALTWQRVTGQEELSSANGERMAAVTAGPSGWVAVGTTVGDQGADGAVWGSADGWEWSRAGDEALGGPGDQRLLDVAAGTSGLAAVGSEGESAAVWLSPDGGSWQRVPAGAGAFGGPGRTVARAVAALAGGPGWVVVGSDDSTGSADAAVWLSPDGVSWERVADAEGLGGDGDQGLFDVAVGPAGLVAVGSDGGSAAAWTSADGRSWSRVDLGPGRVAGVGFDGGGSLVAVGSTGGDGLDSSVWRSDDGANWERVEDGALSGPLDQEVSAVARGEGITVGVGRSNLGGGDDASAWASNDGAGWARSPHDEEILGGDRAQVMAGVAVAADGGGQAVAVGWSGSTPDSGDAAVWITDLRGGGARSRL